MIPGLYEVPYITVVDARFFITSVGKILTIEQPNSMQPVILKQKKILISVLVASQGFISKIVHDISACTY